MPENLSDPSELDIEDLVRTLDDRIDVSKRWISERLDGGLFMFVKELVDIEDKISQLKDISKRHSGDFGKHLSVQLSIYENDMVDLRKQHILFLERGQSSQRAFENIVFMHQYYWKRSSDGYVSGHRYLLIAYGAGIVAVLTTITSLWGHKESVELLVTAGFLLGIGLSLCSCAISMRISYDAMYSKYYSALVHAKITSRDDIDFIEIPNRKKKILFYIHISCFIGSLVIFLVCILLGFLAMARLAGGSVTFLKLM
ncbi:MAG: hypothetical protein IPK66_11935 [Rhodospirillales bacterium]|nr:hypothetical protein [Rhodospirillales bacterium]